MRLIYCGGFFGTESAFILGEEKDFLPHLDQVAPRRRRRSEPNGLVYLIDIPLVEHRDE